MRFSPKRHKDLLKYLQVIYVELLIDEFMGKKFREKQAREKYFKRVYEQLELGKKENEEAFMIGALAEHVFRSLPSDFENPHEWERKWFQ